ncbi:hypothetical protein Fmac_017830 [Flemingia macrophylla]|uniref:Uncharacterized protein n=1 Tax=Flemingia macrophylla TaxID=520843 RepID=A0ABD1M384_9FABA
MADTKNLIKKAMWPKNVSSNASSSSQTSTTIHHPPPPKISMKDFVFTTRPTNPPNTTSPTGTPLPKMSNIFGRKPPRMKGIREFDPHKGQNQTKNHIEQVMGDDDCGDMNPKIVVRDNSERMNALRFTVFYKRIMKVIGSSRPSISSCRRATCDEAGLWCHVDA